MRKTVLYTLTLTIVGFFVLVGVTNVVAASAESVFGGKVLVLKKRPPTSFKSAGGFVQFLRSNAITSVYADEDNTWSFETMAFFSKPLGDYEVEMVFYDTTNGTTEAKRKFVDSYTQYTQDRNTRILSGKAHLTRPSFDANRSYQVEVQKKGVKVAAGAFSTKGVSQDDLDDQKRIENEIKKMEESMKELQQKAKEQEEAAKEADKNASEDLF